MDLITITSEFQLGLILMELDKPVHITFSTYDLDVTLFVMEFYDPLIEYDIWYWTLTRPMNEIPFNVHLHQLNNNHCKFWYIETKKSVRLIITSCNLTNLSLIKLNMFSSNLTLKISKNLVIKFSSILTVPLLLHVILQYD